MSPFSRADPRKLIDRAMYVADIAEKPTEQLAALKLAHELWKFSFVLYGDPATELELAGSPSSPKPRAEG